jgi:peptidoglycan/LPS O-acetylase OafA/YrhL
VVGKKRNFGLDLVRATSIYLVLLAHYYSWSIELGVLGVQIFFVLSGFLIGQIIIHDFKNGGTISTVFNFWRRRWFRTLPMYYLILILKIVIFGNPFGWKILVYFLFLQANFLGIDFFPISWSLVVEEWFYIFLPIAILIPFRNGIIARRFQLYILLAIVFIFILRFLWNYLHKGLIVYQFDCLLVGVLLAGLKIHNYERYSKLVRPGVFFFGLAGTVFMLFVLGDMSQVPLFSPFYRVVWYLFTSLFIMCMFPFIEASQFVNVKIRGVKIIYYFMTWTSVLTYSIYLIHSDVFGIQFGSTAAATVFLHLLVLYGLAFLFYSLFEHPMLNLRDGFSGKSYTKSIREFTVKI